MFGVKKILVLGAGEGQLSLIHRAKDRGFYVLVVSPPGDYPGFTLASKCCYVDIADKEKVLGVALAEGIDAIATDQTDVSISTVDYVARRLGLPHIICEDIENFRDKQRMREICKAKGLPSISYCLIKEPQEAVDYYETLPFSTVIVKPVDSQGSRGVQKVNDKKYIVDAVLGALKYSKSKKVIVEQFVEGHEIEVDSIVKDGEVLFSLVGDVYNFERENTFSAYERVYPTELSEKVRSNIISVNQKTILSLGILKGWTHGEYIMTEEGEVYLLEVGARGGGNYIGSDIVRAFCGYGTDEMALMTAIGDDSFYNNLKQNDIHCAYKCFYLPEGVVQAIEIDKDYLNQPYVLRHNLDALFIGKHIGKNTDKTSRYTIVVQAPSYSELRKILDDASKRIRVGVMTDMGMKHAIWQ